MFIFKFFFLKKNKKPILDEESNSVRMTAGGLEFEWADFPLRTDAMRLFEMLSTYMSMNNDDDQVI